MLFLRNCLYFNIHVSVTNAPKLPSYNAVQQNKNKLSKPLVYLFVLNTILKFKLVSLVFVSFVDLSYSHENSLIFQL